MIDYSGFKNLVISQFSDDIKNTIKEINQNNDAQLRYSFTIVWPDSFASGINVIPVTTHSNAKNTTVLFARMMFTLPETLEFDLNANQIQLEIVDDLPEYSSKMHAPPMHKPAATHAAVAAANSIFDSIINVCGQIDFSPILQRYGVTTGINGGVINTQPNSAPTTGGGGNYPVSGWQKAKQQGNNPLFTRTIQVSANQTSYAGDPSYATPYTGKDFTRNTGDPFWDKAPYWFWVYAGAQDNKTGESQLKSAYEKKKGALGYRFSAEDFWKEITAHLFKTGQLVYVCRHDVAGFGIGGNGACFNKSCAMRKNNGNGDNRCVFQAAKATNI